MRQRRELINLIGDATAAGSHRMFVADQTMDCWADGIAWDDPRVREVERRRLVVADRLRIARARLEIRFPDDSEVLVRFAKWQKALMCFSTLATMRYAKGEPYDPSMKEDRRRAADDARQHWLEAARDVVAALDRGDSSDDPHGTSRPTASPRDDSEA
jgi:hypothetical protein